MGPKRPLPAAYRGRDRMNPLRIAEQLRTDYLQLLTTTFAPRQEGLKRDFGVAVEREGFLTREPFVSLALPYQQSSALTELLPETRERFGAIAETPYAHQGEAVRRVDHCLRVKAPYTRESSGV